MPINYHYLRKTERLEKMDDPYNHYFLIQEELWRGQYYLLKQLFEELNYLLYHPKTLSLFQLYYPLYETNLLHMNNLY